MYFVYVLQSVKDAERYYVGLTNDMTRRLESHNAGESTYTSKDRPWKLIVTVSFEKLYKAEAFEKYLKSGSGRAFCRKHF
jgi:putative endonuclease